MSVHDRTGTPEDSHDVFQVFVRTIMDHSVRMNVMAIAGGNHPVVTESLANKRESMFESLVSGEDFGAEAPLMNGKVIR